MKIDWTNYAAEDILSTVAGAPGVASVWQYSEITHGYQRHLLWHPKKGSQVTWISVGTLWSDETRNSWWGHYDFETSCDELLLGPFPDRFAAATAVDAHLEQNGWKLCK